MDASTAATIARTVSVVTARNHAVAAKRATADLAFRLVSNATSDIAQTVYLKTRGVKAVKKKRNRFHKPEPPKLRFTPSAWAKLLYLRDYGDTEVGGFGICPNHPLLVEDIKLVKQKCTFAFVSFDDESVADFFEDQVAEGLTPEQFARVWIHTHPGSSAEPSHTDEDTFERVFGKANWAVMAILAKGGESYARLRLSGGLEQGMLLETEVDFSQQFDAAEFDDWECEYFENVVAQDLFQIEQCDWIADDSLNPSGFIPDANQFLDTYLEDEYLDEQYEQFERFENASS